MPTFPQAFVYTIQDRHRRKNRVGRSEDISEKVSVDAETEITRRGTNVGKADTQGHIRGHSWSLQIGSETRHKIKESERIWLGETVEAADTLRRLQTTRDTVKPRTATRY